MTDKTPKDAPAQDTSAKGSAGTPAKSNTARNAAIGAAATIGSAAVAAALLYAGKRFRKTPKDSAIGANQSDTAPSGEPPETD